MSQINKNLVDPKTLFNEDALNDAPLVALVSKSPSAMNDTELADFTTKVRALRATPQKARKAVKVKKAPTIDISGLL